MINILIKKIVSKTGSKDSDLFTVLDKNKFNEPNYINSMTSRDYNKIINASNAIRSSFGLDRSLEVKCPYCKRPYQSEASIVPEFFRPSDED